VGAEIPRNEFIGPGLISVQQPGWEKDGKLAAIIKSMVISLIIVEFLC
jgi:hypothetical protein